MGSRLDNYGVRALTLRVWAAPRWVAIRDIAPGRKAYLRTNPAEARRGTRAGRRTVRPPWTRSSSSSKRMSPSPRPCAVSSLASFAHIVELVAAVQTTRIAQLLCIRGPRRDGMGSASEEPSATPAPVVYSPRVVDAPETMTSGATEPSALARDGRRAATGFERLQTAHHQHTLLHPCESCPDYQAGRVYKYRLEEFTTVSARRRSSTQGTASMRCAVTHVWPSSRPRSLSPGPTPASRSAPSIPTRPRPWSSTIASSLASRCTPRPPPARPRSPRARRLDLGYVRALRRRRGPRGPRAIPPRLRRPAVLRRRHRRDHPRCPLDGLPPPFFNGRLRELQRDHRRGGDVRWLQRARGTAIQGPGGPLPGAGGVVLEHYGAIYANEDQCRASGLVGEARRDYHEQHSRPHLRATCELGEDLIEARKMEPNSDLAAAFSYAKENERRLETFTRNRVHRWTTTAATGNSSSASSCGTRRGSSGTRSGRAWRTVSSRSGHRHGGRGQLI